MNFDRMFFQDPVTTVDTTARYPLGTLRQEIDATFGNTIYRYVTNSEAATAFAKGTLVMHKAATVGPAAIVSTGAVLASGRLLGAAQWAIAAGSSGWIVCQGGGFLLGDGSVTADTALVSDATAGRVKTIPGPANATEAQANAVAAFATALEDDGIAGSAFKAVIRLF